MKKLIMIAAFAITSFSLFAAHTNVPNEKAKKSFAVVFPSVTNEVWYENGATSTVRFIQNGIDNRITYDTNGNILNSMRYYGGKDLPALLKDKLQKSYPGKEVFGVTEITIDNGPEYYIILQDDKKWYHVTSSANGQMSVDKKFLKQNQ